jgi:hypothetical protein
MAGDKENHIKRSFIICVLGQILYIKANKLKRVRWARNVASMERWGMYTTFW